MKFYSTHHKSSPVSFREAVIQGLAGDNGLFLPENLPALPEKFLNTIDELSFPEIAFTVAKEFVGNEIPETALRNLVEGAFDFDAPLVTLDDRLHVLELFHGPTLAFKDFGARFMAGVLSHFVSGSDKELTIVVATSGDTGSAVAGGFFKVPGIRVFILYPSGKVSRIQEQQLTTWGENITALEVDGTFDDCQRMVKQAFSDKEILSSLSLTSANSINIARLIPQSFYYFRAWGQLRKFKVQSSKFKEGAESVVFSVPSGNFGNLTAGLFAARMGLPVERFIAATNVNDVVPEYLHTEVFRPRPSIATISNAMDVGDPSNFARMKELFPTVGSMRERIIGFSFTDEQTRSAMKTIYNKYQYISDPHGAVGYLGLESDFSKNPASNFVFLETAHPAKFKDVVEDTLGEKIPVPERLKTFLEKEKQSIRIMPDFDALKNILLS